MREQYIVTQAIIVQALGILGNYFFKHPEVNMDAVLTGLQNVDWLRTAQCWKGRVVRANGKIINSNDAAHLVCNVLKDAIGIALDSEDQIYEEKFQREN